jgi:hypothetical protein
MKSTHQFQCVTSWGSRRSGRQQRSCSPTASTWRQLGQVVNTLQLLELLLLVENHRAGGEGHQEEGCHQASATGMGLGSSASGAGRKKEIARAAVSGRPER